MAVVVRQRQYPSYLAKKRLQLFFFSALLSEDCSLCSLLENTSLALMWRDEIYRKRKEQTRIDIYGSIIYIEKKQYRIYYKKARNYFYVSRLRDAFLRTFCEYRKRLFKKIDLNVKFFFSLNI